MSDERLDALAETARNRGLKLVRSRVRTPGKRRFGMVGLTDRGGNPVFGMDDKDPVAKPEEVEEYLRNLGAKDWGASLGVAVMPRKRKAAAKGTGRRAAANDLEPAKEPPPPPRPPDPKPKVREAKPGDAAEIVALAALIGADVDKSGLRKRMAALAREQLTPLVATIDKRVVGVCVLSRMTTLHRDRPVGRVSMLVIAEAFRRKGIGRMLTEAAEQRLKALRCGIVEITSNDRLTAAHGFYRHLGYERTSIRFAKTL